MPSPCRCSTASSSTTPLVVLSSFFLLSFIFLVLVPRVVYPPLRILPAIPAYDDDDDDLALFPRATLAPPDFRATPTPKVAFLFLTNSNLSFAPLWERFFRGHAGLFNVYVHADPTTTVGPPGGVFRGRFIPAKPTWRANPTLISAARRLLAAALLDDPANAFFALVSQHCIPLHSFRFVYHALLDDADADAAAATNATSDRSGHPPRYRSFIEIFSGIPMLWGRYVARGDGVMLPEVPFGMFRGGSQFFVLTRRHTVLVLRDWRLWKKFRLPCLKGSCYPEEHYFPTLLWMQDPAGCSGYALTRVNWTGSIGGHPHMYRPGEVTADLVRELRRSNGNYSYLFARKFSPDCLDPLLQMADSALFEE